MNPVYGLNSPDARRMVLLAPSGMHIPGEFSEVCGDAGAHKLRLAEIQRLRGRVYLRDGAITERQLTRDGRHIQRIDAQSWHVAVLNRRHEVAGCARLCAHAPGTRFQSLGVRESALCYSDVWGSRFQRAVEAEMADAARRGIWFAELGGWALDEELRATSEALRISVAMCGLAQLLGGALAITTATTRHHSSTILRKFGGRSFFVDNKEIPPYYDPQYSCEMEILRFDSTDPNPRYASWVNEVQLQLASVPVVCAEMAINSLGWVPAARTSQNGPRGSWRLTHPTDIPRGADGDLAVA